MKKSLVYSSWQWLASKVGMRSRNVRLWLLAFVASTLLLHAGASGQFLEIGGSPNVVGSGARAMGMGGAFIAVADDATAASWNPGGLVQLERPEISVVGEYGFREEDYDGGRQPGLSGSNSVDLVDLNYLSLVYPLPVAPLNRNIVLSLNYQRRYDFERQLEYRLKARDLVGGIVKMDDEHYEYSQHGSLNALTPAIAVELSKRLSLGMAVNLYLPHLGQNGWEEEFVEQAHRQVGGRLLGHTYARFKREYEDFEGTNYTFGLLWNATNRLSFGAVYHTPFRGSVTRTRSNRVFGVYLGSGGSARYSHRKEDWDFEFPRAYGVGLAYRFPNDKLTVSFDVTRREWDEFVSIDSAGRRYSPITGRPKSWNSIDPVYTARLGFEYVFFDKNKLVQDYLTSLRGGLIYDPEPASRGVAGFYAATTGIGLLIKDRVNIDLAYEFRYGSDVRKDAFTDSFGKSLGRADVTQHQFLLSTVIYF